jgi:RNA polymerase sigma factor (sigma-70 family)
LEKVKDMVNAPIEVVLRQVRRLAAGEGVAGATDGQLLERFSARQEEAAFAALLHRHGPMVLGVARRVLRQQQDAEDVLQATFLVLARKAGSIRKRESVASWLHGVAYRLAVEATGQRARRQAHERQAGTMRHKRTNREGVWQELEEALDQALSSLPEKYREAVVLCCLEGKTQEEAARQARCPLGTVRSRLARGRELLRQQLARCGVPLSAGALATFLAASAAPAALPVAVLGDIVRASLQTAPGKAAAGIVSRRVTALMEGATKVMMLTRAKSVVALVVTLTILATAAVCARQSFSANNSAAGEEAGAKPQARDLDPKADREKQVPSDLYGDPLPAGALARLGTVRFRHKDGVGHAVFSRDGKTLIAGERFSGQIVFWDAATGKELRRFQAERLICSLAVSPDGKTLAGACSDNIRLWDIATSKLLRGWKSPQMRSLVFSPDGKTLASHAYDDLIYLWNPATGEKRHELKGHRGRVSAFAFSPDGKQLASCSQEDNVVRLWDVAAGREVRQLKGEGRSMYAVAWSPDGKTVAATGHNTLYLWDPATGRERARMTDNVHGVPSPIAYLPDGSALVGLQSNYHTVRLYDPATGKVLRSFDPTLAGMVELAISPDGKRVVASGGGPHTPELWDVANGKLLGAEGHRQPVTCLAFTADGKTLYSGSGTTEYALRVWDPASGKELRRLERGDGTQGTEALAVSPDGRLLAVGTYDGRGFEGVSLRDPATAREVRRLKQPGRIMSVCFAADGKRLATYTWDQGKVMSIRLWDVATGKPGLLIHTGQDWPTPAALSPDGKVVAAGGYQDGAIRVWDTDTGKKLRQFEVCPNPENARYYTGYPVAFSPDGRLLAVGGWRGTTGLWDIATGQLVRRLDDPGTRVAALAFSPDGRTLVTGSDAVRLWEVATGQVRATRTGHAGEVCSLAFSGDGRFLASGSIDTTILTWDLANPAAQLTRPMQDALWDDLAGDVAKAYRAVQALAAAPKQAVAFLRERLKPVQPLTATDRERFAGLLADLDSGAFAIREKAAAELEQRGDTVEPLLRQALAGKPSLEVRRRLEKLLANLNPESPNRLRMLRAVEVLEHAGGAEARRLLEELAGGAPEAWLTREARTSLERRARRPVAAH